MNNTNLPHIIKAKHVFHKVLTREFISIEKMEVKPHYTEIKSEINVLDNIDTICRKRFF